MTCSKIGPSHRHSLTHLLHVDRTATDHVDVVSLGVWLCLVYAPRGRSCERCACCCLSWHAACMHAWLPPDEKNAFQPHACTTTHVLHAHINAWAMGVCACLPWLCPSSTSENVPALTLTTQRLLLPTKHAHKQTHSTQHKTNTLVHTRTHMHTRSPMSSLHTATLVQTRQS